MVAFPPSLPFLVVKASGVDPADRLDRLINRVELAFQAQFRSALRVIRNEAGTLDEIERLIREGRTLDALVSAESAALRSLGGPWSRAFVLAGEEAAAHVGRQLGVVVNFDQTNERAVQRMRENQLRLVQGFTAQQRDATRTAITESIRRGDNPRDAARRFRGSIGLTERQVRAVGNFRNLLESNSASALTRQLRDRRFDSTIRRAIDTNRPLSSAQINRMVTRYEERYLRYRSEVIARTEALRSVHEGTDELYRQAVDDGTLNPAELVRRWNTALDDRVRDPAHTAMHGQLRGLNEPFESGLGNSLMRPGDVNAPPEETIQCRCRISTRFSSF